jgi:hypothetical protein
VHQLCPLLLRVAACSQVLRLSQLGFGLSSGSGWCRWTSRSGGRLRLLGLLLLDERVQPVVAQQVLQGVHDRRPIALKDVQLVRQLQQIR